ncbi:MAG: type II toxin-antitoxin system RelE/ParE family toxin [Bacteroidota bacterium]
MKISFTKDFNKELSTLKDPKLARLIHEIINMVEKAKSPWEINSIKKIKGHKKAYRIRKGTLRLGIFIEKDEVLFSSFDNRKDIYKNFP